MNIEQLKEKNAQEIRELVKSQPENPEIVALLDSHFQETVNVFIKSKVLPDFVFNNQSVNNLEIIFQACIDNGFCPDIKTIEKFVSAEIESIIVKLILKFSSLPIGIQFVLRTINEGLEDLATEIIVSRKEFQTDEVLSLTYKQGFVNSKISELYTKNTKVFELYIRELKNKSKEINFSLANLFFSNFDITPELEIFDDTIRNLISKHLNSKNLDSYLDAYERQKSSSNWGYGRNTKSIEYTPEMENIELPYSINIHNAPKDSKYRKRSIKVNPSIADDEELLASIKGSPSEAIYLEAIKRGIKFISQFEVKNMENFCSPAVVRDAVNGEVEIAKYLYKNLSTKYHAQLSKVIPSEEISSLSSSSKKKSYFFEAINLLKAKSFDEFRTTLSKDYKFEKFIQDCKQSSKASACEFYLNPEHYLQLTNEEILGLATTPIRMHNYYYSVEGKELNPRFSIDEAVSLVDKLGLEICYLLCVDKVGFLKDEKIVYDDMKTLYETFTAEFEDSEKLKCFIDKCGAESNLSEDVVLNLAKKFTVDEIKAMGNIESKYSLILAKDYKGNFIVSESEILALCKEKYKIESESFIRQIAERDLDLAQRIVDAYLAGNKGLSKLVGSEVKITRKSVDLFERLAVSLKSNDEDEVKKVLEQEKPSWEDLKKATYYTERLNEWAKGKTVYIEHRDYKTVSDLKDFPNIKFEIKKLSVGDTRWHYSGDGSEHLLENDNFKISSLYFGDNTDEKDIEFAIKIINKYGVTDYSFTEKKSVLKELSNFSLFNINRISILKQIFEENNRYSNLSLVELKELEDSGQIVFDDEVVYKILEEYSDNKEVLNWLISRMGDLSNYVVSEEKFKYSHHQEAIDVLVEAKLNIVPQNKLRLMEIENQLTFQGENFQPIDVSFFSLNEKLHVIKYIETEIDPKYSSLNLKSANIDTLEVLLPYSVMKDSFSTDDNDILRIFCFPPSLINNKKLIKSIKDLSAIVGIGLNYKIESLKQALATFDEKHQVELEDLIDYSDVANPQVRESFSAIDSSTLQSVVQFRDFIKTNDFILKNQSKSNLLKFFRTSAQHGSSYMRDIFQMSQSIVVGLENLNQRLIQLENERAEENQIVELKQSIESIESRLKEVSQMYDAVHMHDRLVKLAGFIKSDPLQPLGQDKFSKLEKDKTLPERIEVKLYFPKTRGDLIYLGDENGWCVNNSSSYGDNVIAKGNILVGLVEKKSEATKENVIALAHFINKGNHNYNLEQLKWSSRIKKSRNVDATKDFNHRAIIEEIKTYLRSREK